VKAKSKKQHISELKEQIARLEAAKAAKAAAEKARQAAYEAHLRTIKLNAMAAGDADWRVAAQVQSSKDHAFQKLNK
jgi:hypothetical protein